MKRRQFLGASLSVSIASAALPWERFFAWFRKWFGEVKRKSVETLDYLEAKRREIDALYERFGEELSALLWSPGPRQPVIYSTGTVSIA